VDEVRFKFRFLRDFLQEEELILMVAISCFRSCRTDVAPLPLTPLTCQLRFRGPQARPMLRPAAATRLRRLKFRLQLEFSPRLHSLDLSCRSLPEINAYKPLHCRASLLLLLYHAHSEFPDHADFVLASIIMYSLEIPARSLFRTRILRIGANSHQCNKGKPKRSH
jgi:hypothetical protein